MSDEGDLVFVYGTLRRGASNAFRMEGAEFVGAGLIRGRLYVIDWYPGFVHEGGPGDWITGEVWRVPASKLEKLDEFEGEEYERIQIAVRPTMSEDEPVPSGDDLVTWVWVWKGAVEGLERVPSGDWMDIERPRPPRVFTCLGCLSLLAIPIGGTLILDQAGRVLSLNSSINKWAGAGLFLMTPVVALLMARLGDRRRERGCGMREATVAFAILLGTAVVIGVLAAFINR